MARKSNRTKKPAPVVEILLESIGKPEFEIVARRRSKRWTTTLTAKGNRKKLMSSTSQLYSRRIDATGPLLDFIAAAMSGRVRIVAIRES